MCYNCNLPNTANVIPKLFHSLYEAANNGKIDEALILQAKAEMLSELVQNNRTMTQTIPELKVLMSHLNICKPYVLPPLETISGKEAEMLIHNFNKLNL